MKMAAIVLASFMILAGPAMAVGFQRVTAPDPGDQPLARSTIDIVLTTNAHSVFSALKRSIALSSHSRPKPGPLAHSVPFVT